MAPKLFLNMQQGHGDVLTFPYTVLPEYESSFPVDAVGTHGCRTCVCVYFPLGNNKCFIAHIDAHMDFTMGGPPSSDSFVCDNIFTAQALVNKVKEKLAATLSGHEAAIEDSELKSKAIVICPYQKIQGHRGTGWYIVIAICDFFGLDIDTMKTRDAHGFIVSPATGDVQRLHWGDDGKARPSNEDIDRDDYEEKFPEELPDKYGWTAFDHTNKREWTALLSRGDWVWADPGKAIGPSLD